MSKKNKYVCNSCKKETSLASLNFVKDDELQINLGLICSNCISGKENEIENLSYSANNKVDIICKASIIDISEAHLNDNNDEINKILANFGTTKQEDLMYVKFKLVHASTNKNKDKFLKDELSKAEKTPILKLLSWEHAEPSIGVIYDSKYVEMSEDDDEPSYLECFAAVSKFKYKNYAKTMAERHAEDELYFSMETYFKGAECSVCSEYFSTAEDGYCSHLKNRFATGSETARILHDLTFAGAGVVINPADVLAESLTLASDSENNLNILESEANELMKDNIKTYTQEELEASVKEAVDKVVVELSDLKTKASELENRLLELEGVKNSIASEKEQVESNLKAVSTELETLKLEIASEKRAIERMSELKSIGYEVPELHEDKDGYNKMISDLKPMSDETFATMKEMVAKTMDKYGKKKGTDKSDKSDKSDKMNSKSSDQNDANASTNDVLDLPLTASVTDTNNSEDNPFKSVSKLFKS